MIPKPKFQPNDIVQATYDNEAIIIAAIEYIRYEPSINSWTYAIHGFGKVPEECLKLYEYTGTKISKLAMDNNYFVD